VTTPAPPDLESSALTHVAVRTVPLAVSALVVGLLTDVAVRTGVVGAATAVLAVAVAGGLMWCARPAACSSVSAAAAAAFGMLLAVRSSAWLVGPNVIAAGGLLLLSVLLARGGSPFHLPLGQMVGRALTAGFDGMLGPALLLRPLRRLVSGGRSTSTGQTGWAVARGLALAVPLLAVLGALLASADAVFATLFSVDVNAGDATAHVALIVFGACTLATLVAASLVPGPDTVVRLPLRLGAVEGLVILIAVDALFGAFAVAQIVALLGGGRHVLETAGLTYAEYARSGFFQLLAVASITLVVLTSVRAVVTVDGRWRHGFSAAAMAAVGLTLVIVLVAVRRLLLYEEAFGLTMLRLFSTVFAVWVGTVFVLLGALLAGVRADRHWLAGSSVVAALTILMVLNVVNPEAVVVRRNVVHFERTGELDVGYLTGLSPDAVPTLLDSVEELPPERAEELIVGLCSRREPPPSGWAEWNAATADTARRLASLCPALPPS